MVVYKFLQSFMKIFWTVLKLQSGHDFNKKNLKGASFRKNVGGVSVLVLCTLSDEFHETILNGIRVMERTRKVNGRTDGRTIGRMEGTT